MDFEEVKPAATLAVHKTPQQQNQIFNAIQSRIIAVCKRYPDGVTEPELKEDLKTAGFGADAQAARLTVINSLLQTRRLALYKDGDTLIYKLVSEEESQKFAGLSPEDIQVYQIIEKGENKGVWQKDIKFRSKLQPKQIATSLARLKDKNLIKPVKTIHGKNKIVYMLANLEPSKEITGGVWYTTDNKFNHELISMLQKAACDFVLDSTKPAGVTAEEVLEYVRVQGYSSQVDLREDDMTQILDTLIYDGLLEETYGDRSGKKHYKTSGSVPPSNAFSAIPCSTCPVFDECTDEGDINPRGCPYLKKWMELDF